MSMRHGRENTNNNERDTMNTAKEFHELMTNYKEGECTGIILHYAALQGAVDIFIDPREYESEKERVAFEASEPLAKEAIPKMIQEGMRNAKGMVCDIAEVSMNFYVTLERIAQYSQNEIIPASERCKDIRELCEKLAANTYWDADPQDDSGEQPYSEEDLKLNL